MARASLLAASLIVSTLAFSPGLTHASDEHLASWHRVAFDDPAGCTAAVGIALAGGQPAPAPQEEPRSDSFCLICHGNPALRTSYADGRLIPLYVDARTLRDSVHGLLSCLTCHRDREVCPPDRAGPADDAAYRAEATQMCLDCHLAAAGDYARSVHGEPVLSGNGEGATCSDCHSPDASGHAVGAVSDSRLPLAPQRVHEGCGACHEAELETYNQTSHSMVARFGDPQRPATCTTCHGDHAVKAVEDPEEPLTVANLAAVCGTCHHGAGEDFASGWLGHQTSPSGRDGIYYAQRAVVFFLAATLAFGLAHMTLDFLRPLADPWDRGGGDTE